MPQPGATATPHEPAEGGASHQRQALSACRVWYPMGSHGREPVRRRETLLTPQSRRPGATTRECGLGFAILTVLFVGAVLGILLRLQPIEAELSDMEKARTRAHAAQELEVHTLGYALGSEVPRGAESPPSGGD